jgi:hypothetical protein
MAVEQNISVAAKLSEDDSGRAVTSAHWQLLIEDEE